MLHDIVNNYNNTVHRTIKVEPIDVTYNTYADSKKVVNDKDPKLKIGDHVRISKSKNILTNFCLLIKHLSCIFNRLRTSP